MDGESEVGADRRPVPGARLWAAWMVLVVGAAPLCLLAVETVRLTLGPLPAFLRGGSEPVSTYDRLAYLVQTAAPDRLLLMSLIGLVAVAWLLRTSVVGLTEADQVRRAAVALTAVLGVEAAGVALLAGYLFVAHQPVEGGMGFYGGNQLEALAPPMLGGVLLLTLSALLLHELLSEVPPVAVAEPAADSAQVDAGPGGDVDGSYAVLDVDPHAAYRRPRQGGPASGR